MAPTTPTASRPADARAADRNAPTAQFRSGSAVPAGEARADNGRAGPLATTPIDPPAPVGVASCGPGEPRGARRGPPRRPCAAARGRDRRPRRGARCRRRHRHDAVRGRPPVARRPQDGRSARRDVVHLPQPSPEHRTRPAAPQRALAGRGRPGRTSNPNAGSARRGVGPRGPLRLARPLRRAAWRASRPWPRSCAAPGHRAVVVADQNALVDRAAAHRAGLGWYGKNSNLLLPGAGSWFVLGSVVTDAALAGRRRRRAPTAAGRCRRCLDALPDRRHRGRRRHRRPPLPGLAGPGHRRVPPGAPRRPGRPDLRLRRLPGRVPARPSHLADAEPAPPVEVGRRPAPPEAWVDAARPARRHRRRAARPPRALVHPRTATPLPAPQRPDRPRQHRRPGRRRQSGGPRPTTSPATTPLLRAHAVWAAPGSGSTTWSPRSADDPDPPWSAPRSRSAPSVPRRRADLVAAGLAGDDEAPAGHQRLPAQGRRHPDAPVGAVAPPRPRRRSPC